ncbi:MAG: ABC-ATPase domain-containing protein [Deltaproteobacteria bacterium]|nr:ABC-ATPase domain-containing protein [Deltaproteobacteria bacterium]
MKTIEALKGILTRIDGRGYKAYKDLKGTYDFGFFTLHIDHVQGDPYAAPSRLRIKVPQAEAGLPARHFANRFRRIGLEDFLTRSFAAAIRKIARGSRGMGKSGLIAIDCGNQEVLERTSMFVSSSEVEARFVMGLPARGRSILGREAAEMFLEEVPQIVRQSLFLSHLDTGRMALHVDVVEDHAALQKTLKERKLVAFIADGSTLPRRSGIDLRPLQEGAIPFASPPAFRTVLSAPNRGEITGMGIPCGVTLIVGGGFHGKSTILNALKYSIFPHIPGDGREYVVTDATAVKIRAEDGRSISGVDISPFINNLPYGKETGFFTTMNASGSTSQAANIMEALEMGSRLLLIDEDTSATNFMIRDHRMQSLVAKEKEPITPFVDQIRPLREDLGVSTILVMGGSGDYLDQADRVILMERYRPLDVTDRAREVVEKIATLRRPEGSGGFGKVIDRRPLPASFDPSRGRREVRIDAKGLQEILFGRERIDLSAVEQLMEISETRAVGEIIHYFAKTCVLRGMNLREGLTLVLQEMKENGLDLLSPYKLGCFAMPRIFEVAAAVNRMRSLKISREGEEESR